MQNAVQKSWSNCTSNPLLQRTLRVLSLRSRRQFSGHDPGTKASQVKKSAPTGALKCNLLSFKEFMTDQQTEMKTHKEDTLAKRKEAKLKMLQM